MMAICKTVTRKQELLELQKKIKTLGILFVTALVVSRSIFTLSRSPQIPKPNTSSIICSVEVISIPKSLSKPEATRNDILVIN